jgi:hypothetical protein
MHLKQEGSAWDQKTTFNFPISTTNERDIGVVNRDIPDLQSISGDIDWMKGISFVLSSLLRTKEKNMRDCALRGRTLLACSRIYLFATPNIESFCHIQLVAADLD